MILLSTNLYSQSNINTIWADNDDDEGDPTSSTSLATMAVSTGSNGVYFSGEKTRGCVTDQDGNVYLAGSFSKKISGSNKKRSIYVYCYSPDGELKWESDIHSSSHDLDPADNSIAIASDGIYVLANTDISTTTSISVTDTSGSVSILSNNVDSTRGVIVKFSFSGQRSSFAFIKYTKWGFSGSPYVNPVDIQVDQFDNVYVIGSFKAHIYTSSNSSILRSNSCSSSISSDIFVMKFSSSLYNVWTKGLDFKDHIYVGGIAIDGNNVYISGTYYVSGNYLANVYSTNGFWNGSIAPTFSTPTCTSPTPNLLNTGYAGGFLIKLDQNGAFVWNKRIQSASTVYQYAQLYDVAVKNGNIFVLGTAYSLNMDFNGTFKVLTPSNGTYNSFGFISKVIDNTSSELSVNWTQLIELSAGYVYGGYPNASVLHVDDNNNVYGLFYTYASSSNFLEVYNTPFTSASNPTKVITTSRGLGSRDIIFVKYTSSGNRVWSNIIGGSGEDEGSGIATDANGNVYLGGKTQLSPDLDPTSSSYILSTSGVSPFRFDDFGFYDPYEFGGFGGFYGFGYYSFDPASDGFIAKYGCHKIEIIPEKDTFCAGEVITLNALSKCRGCSYTYRWTDLMNGITINTTNPFYSFTGSSGTNQIILQATEANTDCVVYDTLDILINPAVTVSASPTTITVCPGALVSFSASASPAVGVSYNWYKFADTILQGSSANFSATDPGTYTVVADINGCQSSFNVNLDNHTPYSPLVYPNNPAICGSGGAFLQILDCPGCNYVWTPPPASTSSSTSNTITADVPGNYGVNIVDPFGCQQTLSASVGTAAFLTPPIAAINANNQTINALCNNQPLVLTSIPYGTGSGQCATCLYSWSDGTSGPYAFAFNPGTYSVTVTDALTGCIGSSSNLVIRNSTFPGPTITSAPGSVCTNISPSAGQSSAFLQLTNPCAGCAYSWINNDAPLPTNGLILPANNSSVSVTIPGDYYLRMTDTFGCVSNSVVLSVGSDTASLPLIVSTTNTLCGNNTANLSTLNCNNCSYQWYLDNAQITNANSFQYSGNVAGTYKVEVTYENSCVRFSDNVPITDNANSFLPQIGPVAPYLCNGAPVSLYLSSPTNFLAPPYWTYQWYFNGAPILGQEGYVLNATQAGDYYLEVRNLGGCLKATNVLRVNNSIAGSNPIITTSSPYLCSTLPNDTVRLNGITGSCDTCRYQWVLGNTSLINTNTTQIAATNSGGYYFTVLDSASGCVYISPVFEVKDTQYIAPAISTAGNICSTDPVIISTTACAGCTYEWQWQPTGTATTFTSLGLSAQNTYSATATGNYKVVVTDASDCPTPNSNSVPVTILPFNAQLALLGSSNICNANSSYVLAQPNRTICPDCEYYWYRNGVGVVVPTSSDSLLVTQGGAYYVVVKQTYPSFSTTPYSFGCEDISDTLTFSDISVSVDLESSAAAICGPSGLVTLDVNSCSACSYAWFYDGDTTIAGGGLNYIPLTGVNDTFYTVNGAAAEGMYKIRVTKAGCQVFDSILLADVPAPVYTLDSSSAPYANICGGTPITLTASCVANCNLPIVYQWYKNSVPIAGAIGASNLVISAGDYQLITTDNNGCVTSPPTTTVIEVNPPSGFGLVLDPVSVVPLTNADFDLDPYLNPVSLHTTDAYSAVPQPAAIVAGDMFSPASAGSGPHLVSYTYNFQNCSFVARDTIQVLSPMAVDVVNLNALAPPYESCLFDNIRFILSNFTFAPNQILFPTSSTTFDTVTVSNAGLTQFAGVWSGNINVIVPNGAITGKVVFRNSASGDRFQAPFFLVVQNPAVALSLNGVPQPLCSNADTIILSGFPTGGSFEAAYSDSTNVIITSLMSGNNFLVENVSDYDLVSGSRFLKLTYIYTPTYSNNADFCPDVIDSLNVQVNNMELDSIEYTPISETQSNVPLATLTRLIWPLENRNYPGNYVGTYVTGNNIQANTLPIPSNATSVNDSVFYTFTNGICSNTIGEEVSVWKRPTILDSIPLWVCQSDDTIFIGRNGSGLYVTRNGTTYTSDANYVYENNQGITNGVDYSYDEKINIMTLSSSNGGLLTINPVLGADRYALVPQLISGTSTDITMTFTYNRNTDYFTEPTITTNYVIAAVTKTVNVEAPIAAQISPAILDDTTFCQDNVTQQFSGIPNGGQYYLNGDSLPSNIFNPNSLVAGLVTGVNANIGVNRLTYIFRGNACTDSASTNILIPAQFSITITASNAPDYCQLDEPDSIIVLSSNPAFMDNAAGVFLVNTSNSGQFFNPALPPAQLGPNFVKYIAQDSYGCTAVDSTIFNVNPMPKLRMTSFDPAYCLNATPVVIDLFEDTLFNPNDWHLQSNGYNAPYDSFVVTLTGRGVMPSGNNPQNPMYSPLQAGVGLDTIVYTFSDTVTGCSSTISDITFIKPLPALTLTTTNGNQINPEYCERDTFPVFATPAGGAFLNLQVFSGGPNFNTAVPQMFYANIPGITPATATEIIGYTYQDLVTLCRDTIRDTILVRNFTTDVTIIGLPNQVCADNINYLLNPDFGAGPQVTGSFGSLFPEDSAMIIDTLTNTGRFNPYYSGIYDRGRDVVVTYTYSSNNCSNTVYDTATLKPLPQLTIIMPGDTLFNSTDPIFHICFSAPTFPLQGLNTYMGSTTPIVRDVNGGVFNTNSLLGIVPAFNYWDYIADSAKAGLDTINFVYTSPLTGCTNTKSEPIVVDTVPDLGFAGFDPFKLDPNTGRFVYCANDMPHLVIPSPFGGATYWNYNPIPSILFELRPDTLVVGGQTTIHRLSYEFISARYQGGGVCIDSTIQFVEVRPTPILNLATSVPDFFCVSNSAQFIPLSASPTGGQFEDISNQSSGGIVIGGIVEDSVFVPIAQMGRRIVMYYYTDNQSGCTDTISQNIDVYNLPDVSFETGGGCIGDVVHFLPNPTGLSSSFPAIDSITMAIWNYGDGLSDTLTQFPNQTTVPIRTHIYNATGIYYPTLTLVNRGTCDTTFMKRIVISPKYLVNDTMPYLQDFQATAGDWFQDNELPFVGTGVDTLWEWGIAEGQRITTIQENNLVWKTDLDSSYRSGEKGWVLSPCFDIGTLRRPMVALDIWRDSREGVDGVVLQYFDSLGQSWENLGIRGKGINWYNPSYVIAAPGDQVGAPIGWSGISNSWEDARYRLDVAGGDLRGQRNLRLRLAFASSPNSVVGNLEGFAFDNFYIGNRTRSVLLEHFTNQNYSGMGQIETDLYRMVYSSLYGRDVNLVQYHTEYDTLDYLHQQSIDESNSRVFYYGINNADQIRINGQSLLSRTSDLVNGAAETLDMQMLQDAKFKIKLYPVSIQQGNMTITADVSALEDISYDDYALHLVVTEDSIESLQSHNLMSVVRTMRPDASGTTLPGTWVSGDLLQVANTWDFGSVSGITYNPNNLKVVVFVQNRNTKEVYQVATSRNLNIFNGPVSNVDEIAMEEGKEILDMNLYPNPTQDYFNVEFNSELLGEYDWKLVDVTGRVLRNGRAEAGTKTILVNTENFSPGIYIFSINNKNVYAQRKVIIAR
jgi:hypothetical protein